jgi:hypothetical protein
MRLTRILKPFSRVLQRQFHSLSGLHNKMDHFTDRLSVLGVSHLPPIAAANPTQNPLDIFRSHIAERLVSLAGPSSGVTLDAVFSGLDRSTRPETGDFVLAIPRLRIKGSKPQDLGQEWQANVHALDLLPYVDISSGSLLCWIKLSLRGHFSNFLSRVKPSRHLSSLKS